MDEQAIVEQFVKLFSLENGLFLFIAFLGMFGHATKKYLAGQLKSSVTDYLFFNNPKRSVLAVLTTVGAALALILGDQLPTQIGAFILLAFTTGFTSDSSVNRDE